MNTDTVFTTFKAPVDSKPLGEMHVGLLKPGRYSGFDVLTENIGLDVRISHSDLVKKSSISVDSVITQINFGAVLTPNGSTVHNETDPAEPGLNFLLDDNLANANERFDLLVIEHEYIQVIGGVPPSYYIIPGDNEGNMPDLTNPEKQVALGYFTIAPNGFNFSHVTWTPAQIPLPGSMTPAQLVQYIEELIAIGYCTVDEPGIIQLASVPEVLARINTNKAITPASSLSLTPTLILPGLVRNPTEEEVKTNLLVAGTFQAYISPDLMRKYARLRDPIYYKDNSAPLSADWNGKVIILNGDGGATPLVTFTIPAGLPKNYFVEFISDTQRFKFVTASGITLTVPELREKECRSLGSRATLECVSETNATKFTLNGDLKINLGTVSTGLVPMLAAVPYFPESNSLAEFDGTGLGLSGDVLGWAICNGNNGTRDLRGRFLVHMSPSDADFATVGLFNGTKTTTLNITHIPPHNHNIRHAAGGSGGFGMDGNGTDFNGGYYNTENAGGTAGAAQPFSILNPFYVTIYIQRIA